jgi:hypothetical protein
MLDTSNQPTQFGKFFHMDSPYKHGDWQLAEKVGMI